MHLKVLVNHKLLFSVFVFAVFLLSFQRKYLSSKSQTSFADYTKLRVRNIKLEIFRYFCRRQHRRAGKLQL